MTQGRQLFAVTILKRDQQHLIVMQTENQDEAQEAWTKLVGLWTQALKEQTPFILGGVSATAFDPGLVYEITINSTELTGTVSGNNPYNKNMLQNGFSESFGMSAKGNSSQSPMLDTGFKF